MIRGYCRTNLDNYERESWPKEFVALPRKGDRVAAKSGKYLYVVGIQHEMRYSELGNPYPIIEVELHHRSG
jgi:hypothetical protein